MKHNAIEPSQGFVLHTYPYRETSLIVEAFIREQGRMVFVAKGAKRPQSSMKGLLNPFQGLRLSWFGRAEMKTLKTVEHEIIYPQLSGAALMSAFYMNELLLKLTHREDPHEAIFDAYTAALNGLTGKANDRQAIPPLATTLRKFELSLLQSLGFGLQLTEEAGTHQPLEVQKVYSYVIEQGPIAVTRLNPYQRQLDGIKLAGKTLLDM
ncbi:MAG: DNA repair protein RecO, partial [Betaproteobacteria bacterium]|nr:DNA repair protein RecO [Betaproteobacteria bacterium]